MEKDEKKQREAGEMGGVGWARAGRRWSLLFEVLFCGTLKGFSRGRQKGCYIVTVANGQSPTDSVCKMVGEDWKDGGRHEHMGRARRGRRKVI